MATITITRGSNSITINSYVENNPGRYFINIDSAPLIGLYGDSGKNVQFNLNDDTVVINGDTFSGTAAELETLLYSDVFVGGSSGTPTVQTIYSLKTILTDAQIKALPNTYVELVQAPGANKVLVFHKAILCSKYPLYGGYGGGGDGAYLGIAYGSDWGTDVTDTIPGSIVEQPGEYTFWVPAKTGSQPTTASIINLGLYLVADNSGTTSFTAGDPSNTLVITVFYSIVDL
jgi:hypothetical protein